MIELLILINLMRTKPLVESKTLDTMAVARAEQIYKSDKFSHDGFGKQWEKTTCGYVGENLAKDFQDDKSTHEAFVASPTHKAVMINPKYKYLGVGKYKNITVELFCDKIYDKKIKKI